MKEKIENFLYFLTLWFSTTVIVLGIVVLVFKTCNSVNKNIDTQNKKHIDSLIQDNNTYKDRYRQILNENDSLIYKINKLNIQILELQGKHISDEMYSG